MSKRIKIINNSGTRFPKKPLPNQSDLNAFGFDSASGTYFSLPLEIGAKNKEITQANIGVQTDALSILTNNVNVNYDNTADLSVTLLSAGDKTVTEIGAVWSLSANPNVNDNNVVTIAPDIVTPGVPFNVHLTGLDAGQLTYTSAFVVATGITSGQIITEVVYGGQLTFTPFFCLMEGTLITLSDFTKKKIEDITYDDELLVWNFDEGKFDKSKPLWIGKPSTAYEYSLTRFSDGSELRAIVPHLGHRILNIQKGSFTYTMNEDSLVGETTTFNDREENVTIISREKIKEKANFYNIISNCHINLFANGLITSCRLNNIYPISEMKFIKDNRKLRTIEDYGNISEEVFDGLKLAEQNIPIEELKNYIRSRKIGDFSYESNIS